MAIYKPNMLDKFKDFVNGLRGNADELETTQSDLVSHKADYETHKADYEMHKAESAAKHIAESGSNANGRYIKFDDGTMIQWGEKNFTQSVKYAWGALYVASGEPCTVDFPLTFIETPIIIASPRTTGNASAFFGNYNAIRVYQSSVQYLVQAFRPTESDSVDFVVHWVAIGRWK